MSINMRPARGFASLRAVRLLSYLCTEQPESLLLLTTTHENIIFGKKKKEKQEKKNKKKKKMVEESARGASGREGATGIARGELAQATGKNSVSSLLSVCRGRRSLQCEIHTSEFRASSSWFCCIQVSECKQKRRTDYNCCRRHGWIISEYTNNKVS